MVEAGDFCRKDEVDSYGSLRDAILNDDLVKKEFTFFRDFFAQKYNYYEYKDWAKMLFSLRAAICVDSILNCCVLREKLDYFSIDINSIDLILLREIMLYAAFRSKNEAEFEKELDRVFASFIANKRVKSLVYEKLNYDEGCKFEENFRTKRMFWPNLEEERVPGVDQISREINFAICTNPEKEGSTLYIFDWNTESWVIVSEDQYIEYESKFSEFRSRRKNYFTSD